MSASISKHSVVNNLDDIKAILVPEDKTKQEALRDDDWDNRWNWDTSDVLSDPDDDPAKRNLWLAECKISLSPLTDMLVIARQKVLTIFNFKRSTKETSSTIHDETVHEFNLVYSASLPGLEPNETLTSVALLPFVAQQKNVLINFRDWTAILVGFSTGFFRIYAENGKVLLSHIFHDEPILDIKCRTHSANNLLSEQLDEILIIYPSAVIQIDGFTLYQTLRMCRQNLAKSQHVDSSGQGYFSSFASGADQSNSQAPFIFKKWAFSSGTSDQQTHDCVNVCSYVKNDFDALVSRSIASSPNSKLTNDTANLFLSTGIHPFVGFYRAQEGTTHTIIEELSHVLFKQVKNVLSIFSSQSKPKEADPRENIKPATSVDCSLGLFDERLGFKICLSPNRRLAAVVDDYGRVILFDVANAIAVRIWKGYRKAEVGWIVVEEGNSSNPKEYSKQALFLAIYAPKRGILEIWCSQNGPRVTAFKVGKNCKLLYMDHVMFGLNHLILQNIKHTMEPGEFTKAFLYSKCCLFNYETGELLNINVPFLCALTDRNSKKTRDIHILKDLKVLLKKQDITLPEEKRQKYYQQVVTLVLMLKTAEIRRECLEELIRFANDEQLVFLAAQRMHQDLLQFIDKNELDFENKLVAQMCSRVMQICQCYIKIKKELPATLQRVEKLAVESLDPPDIQELIENLGGWSGNDVARILSLLAFRQSVLKFSSKAAKTDLDFTIFDMLSHFTLYYTHLVKKNNAEIYEKLPIEIILMDGSGSVEKPSGDTRYVSLDRLSQYLFNGIFAGNSSQLGYLLGEACIYPSNLLLLLFTSWLHSSYSIHWRCWENLSQALFKIVDIMNNIRQSEENSEENLLFDPTGMDDRLLAPSWTDIIELIYKSTNITSALIAVNMIKSLINKFKLNARDISELNSVTQVDGEEEPPITTSPSAADIQSMHSIISSDNEWETLHMDKENLSLLTKQLEDLFLLDMLLKSNLCSLEEEEQPEQPKVGANGSPVRFNSISLSFILSSGPGIVSEIVARWAIRHKVPPELLICLPSADASTLDGQDDSEVTVADESATLKRTVERSTTAVTDMADLSARSTLMEILDHVRQRFPNCLESDILLINCCWELLLQWNAKPLILSSDLFLTLSYLEKVSSSVLKHNVACMGWRLFIQKRFEVLCNLIEKMGKKPKDRICRKELEMDENTLENFSVYCCDLLDFLIKTSFSWETEPLPLYQLDDWWTHFNSSAQYGSHYVDVEPPKTTLFQTLEQHSLQNAKIQLNPEQFPSNNVPLAVMAMHQKVANTDLLVEYFHLALSVQFTVTFSLRNVRPLSLFSSSVRAYFFKDLFSFLRPSSSSSESSHVPVDPELCDIRNKFLFNVIRAIVQTLPVYRNEEDRNEGLKFYQTANMWFAKVIHITREWYLNVDRIRLRYVYDLFLFGCDPLAEELMATVSDVRGLGRQLLIIAGLRTTHILNTKFGSLDEISFVPPNILSWLKHLTTDPNLNPDCPTSATVLLLEHIGNFLHDDDANYRICQELLSAIKHAQ